MPSRCCAALLLALLLAGPRPALAIGMWERGELSLEATGSQRLTGAFIHYYHPLSILGQEDDGLAASVTRLMLQGGLHRRLRYEVNLFVDLTRAPGAMQGGALATVSAFRSPYRNRHASWDFWETDTVTGQLGLDRLILTYSQDPVSVSLGRMPINHSVTQLFTPNDLFAPFSTAAINKIYKPGVDALRLSVAPSMLSTVELTAVLGSETDGAPAWSQSALLLRASTVLWGTEWAILGGKLAERWFVGASFQGEAGPFGVRGEGHVGFADRDGDGTLDADDGDVPSSRATYTRVATGVDHRWDWRNASVALEAMYLSDGANRAELYLGRLQSLFPDDVPWIGRLYLGLSAGGEILPILRIHAMALCNALDFSGLGALTLVYSIADEAEFVGGLLVPWGNRHVSGPGFTMESEFGLMPLTAFLETRFYF